MLRLLVIHPCNKKRQALKDKLVALVTSEEALMYLKVRIDVASTNCLEAVCMGSSPQLILIGNEAATSNLNFINKVKRTYPNSHIVVEGTFSNLAQFQQLILHGATDYLDLNLSKDLVLQKLILIIERLSPTKSGKVIGIDSSKGCVGVTTLAVALSIEATKHAKKVAVVDLDFECQDLTRFLNVKPFLSEGLERILTGSIYPSIESVTESCVKIWEEFEVYVVQPTRLHENLIREDNSILERFKSFLEVLSCEFDFVIIDFAQIPTFIALKLYKILNELLLIVSLDVAKIHSSLITLKSIQSKLDSSVNISLVATDTIFSDLSFKEITKEFNNHLKNNQANWIDTVIPFNKKLSLWPGSSYTPIDLCSSNYAKSITKISEIILNLQIENKKDTRLFTKYFNRNLLNLVTTATSKVELPKAETLLPLSLSKDSKDIKLISGAK